MMDQLYQQLQDAIRQVNAQHEQFKKDFWPQAMTELKTQISPELQARLYELKLTHSEGQILSALADAVEPLSYKRLSEQMPFTQGMFSRYINRLAKAGLIHKLKRANNHKEIILDISATGLQVAELHTKMHIIEAQHYQQALGAFSAQDIQIATNVIEKLSQAL
ncbi:MAG: MarR family winged helix-turn-helix transcriptional regulator [Lactobacillus sp.]|jgi:DNA-binding MarR family transcriptional regulator|nr:MarR family winged helix-turn-helix transcriptional regulator [Lactobacillus sp.]